MWSFWRRPSESLARHRNPLFDTTIGVTPWASITIDVMHTFHLGITNAYCKHVLWELLTQGAWVKRPTQEETVASNILMCDHERKTWFKSYHRAHPGEKTSPFKVRRKIVGDTSERKLTLKAAQTWYFLLFMISVLTRCRSFVDGAECFLEAGNLLADVMRKFERGVVVRSLRDRQVLWDAWLRFCVLCEEFVATPKRHLAMHLLRRMPWFGGPGSYANWLDESDNKLMKQCCRRLSQQTLEVVLLQQMKYNLESRSRKRDLPGI